MLNRNCEICGRKFLFKPCRIKTARFCSRRCANKKISKTNVGRTGDKSYHWKGGRKQQEGYTLLYYPDHPFANSKGYIPEHRLVMEGHLGRPLLSTEAVHHINGIRNDNRVENLALFTNTGYHLQHHLKFNEESTKEEKRKIKKH